MTMRILKTILLAGAALPALVVQTIWSQTIWPGYGGDASGQRFSALTLINTRNVAKLKMAWQYGVDPGGYDINSTNRLLTGTEAVPIMAGGILYTPTFHHTIVALEPETGKEIWKYELGRSVAAPLRGVTYWAGDKDN